MRTIRLLLIMALLFGVNHLQARKSKREIATEPSSQEAVDAPDGFTAKLFAAFSTLYERGVDEKLYLQCDKPYYSAGEKIWFKGYLRNAVTHTSQEWSNFIYVELIGEGDELVSRVKVRRDTTGFSGYITLDPEMATGWYTLRGYTRWMLNDEPEGLFSRAVQIVSPIPTKEAESKGRESRESRRAEAAKSLSADGQEYTVQFFPEGGDLLPGALQAVAFKALGEDGLSVEFEGEIFNSSGESIREIKSSHKGMGMVSLFPELGESYYAVVRSSEGVERRFDLPAVESRGAVVSANLLADRLYLQVRATDAELLEGSHILVHTRGTIVLMLEADTPRGVWVVPRSELLDGVSVVTLISKEGVTMSERLLFSAPTHLPQISILKDDEDYAARERAVVSVKVLDSNGEPAKGEFAVSITDDSSIILNPASENILSYMLLSSDLMGYIEDPGLYFDGSATNSIDLLMRTQGWRRFDISALLRGEFPERSYQHENEVEISGSVKGFFGNEARNPSVEIMSLDPLIMQTFELDESSRFRMLLGTNIPDSTKFMIKALGRTGGNMLTLNIDPEPYAVPRSTIVREARAAMEDGSEEESYIPLAFVNQSQEKFFYEGGMNTIDIEAVSVTAKRMVMPSQGGAFYTRATGREDLDAMLGLALPYIIQSYPGMTVDTDGVLYRDNEDYARFIVNGMDMEYIEVEYLTADDIETIAYFSPIEATIFNDSEGGVFVIDLREDYMFKSKTLANIAQISPLGYQRHMTLYQPSYDNPTLRQNLPPDYRTTIFWSGELTPDEQGLIEFELFTADKVTSYTITLEGITDSGEVCRASSTMMRTLRY